MSKIEAKRKKQYKLEKNSQENDIKSQRVLKNEDKKSKSKTVKEYLNKKIKCKRLIIKRICV